jgi:hypothetical protein
MGWFECRRCGEFKAIRVQSVERGVTVSCGCKGRRQPIAHDQQQSDNLPAAGRPHQGTGSLINALTEKYKPVKTVIDSVSAALRGIHRVMAGAGKAVFVMLQWPAHYYASHYLSDNRLFPGS